MTIAGNGLLDATSATFGGAEATIQRAFENALVVETPAARAADIVVTVDTESATLVGGFTYDPPLSIGTVTPDTVSSAEART